jgi:four helix bundle protein
LSFEPRAVRGLKVWQKSVSLVEACYRITVVLPREERFGLISQIRRAATSVPANIAEGFGRWNSRELAHFLSIANGSLRELETHLIICVRLGFIADHAAAPLYRNIDELARMLYALRERVGHGVEKIRAVRCAAAPSNERANKS